MQRREVLRSEAITVMVMAIFMKRHVNLKKNREDIRVKQWRFHISGYENAHFYIIVDSFIQEEIWEKIIQEKIS